MFRKSVLGFAFLAGCVFAQAPSRASSPAPSRAASLAAPSSVEAGLVLQDLDYRDHLQTLPNYDRGFYRPQVLHLKPSGTKPVEKSYGKLLHLRGEISEFSSRAWLSVDTTGGRRDTTWGKSQDLTEDALSVLQTSFDNIRASGGKVIVRICYDPWYKGRSNVTPEHKWVLRHVEQLAPVLSKNTDVIMALEMGMHGAYGEMHSDTSITYPRVAEAANLMLRLTPPELKILTRTGNYSAAVLGFENWGVDFHIDGDVFKKIAEAKGDTMYRVGMFNDGYLGTQYDYGTWGADCKTSICREEGVAWLEKYSINTPYGGEALTTASGYQVINTPEFLAYEGFRTHTSYLNIEWNYNLINDWKAKHFTGKDYEYDGSKIDTLTGFKYIDDHLGYRFILRESWLPDTVGSGKTLRAKLKVQNVGFGNLTKNVPVYIGVEPAVQDTIEFGPDPVGVKKKLKVDFRDIHSRKIEVANGDTTMTFDGVNEFEVALNEKDMPMFKGVNDVYLIVDGVYFANESAKKSNVFTDSTALYIGSFLFTQKEYDEEEFGISALPLTKTLQTNSRVERADQKIQVRDGRGKTHDGRSGLNTRENLFRVNGVKFH